MEQSTVNQRIKILVDTFSAGNKSAFAKRVGISNQSLGEIVGQRHSSPSFPALQKLLKAFPQLCTDWLLLGEGPMLKSDPKSESSAQVLETSSYTARAVGTIPPAAGEAGMSTELRRGTRAPGSVRNYDLSTRPAPAVSEPVSALTGIDLLQQVARNTADIDELRTQLARVLKQQEKAAGPKPASAAK